MKILNLFVCNYQLLDFFIIVTYFNFTNSNYFGKTCFGIHNQKFWNESFRNNFRNKILGIKCSEHMKHISRHSFWNSFQNTLLEMHIIIFEMNFPKYPRVKWVSERVFQTWEIFSRKHCPE